MSCCGGNCGCGSACKCGSGCGGCKMYPEMAEEVTTSTTQAVKPVIVGVAPSKGHPDGLEAAAVAGADNEGCNCNPCNCNPCNCK